MPSAPSVVPCYRRRPFGRCLTHIELPCQRLAVVWREGLRGGLRVKVGLEAWQEGGRRWRGGVGEKERQVHAAAAAPLVPSGVGRPPCPLIFLLPPYM